MKVIETTTIVLFGYGVSALTSHVQYFYRISIEKTQKTLCRFID